MSPYIVKEDFADGIKLRIRILRAVLIHFSEDITLRVAITVGVMIRLFKLNEKEVAVNIPVSFKSLMMLRIPAVP